MPVEEEVNSALNAHHVLTVISKTAGISKIAKNVSLSLSLPLFLSVSPLGYPRSSSFSKRELLELELVMVIRVAK